jgi:hypothetical protein
MIYVVLAALVAALVGGAIWQHCGGRRRCSEHFKALARRHGLSAEQMRLAWQVARRFVPASPLEVFLRPSLWQRAALGRGPEAPALRAIAAHLFER